MINESQLIAELEAADKAGVTAHAQMIADKIMEQRTAWSKANNFTNNNIVNKYGIEEADRQLREVYGGNYNAAEGMSNERQFAVSMGRGMMDPAQGVKQLWKLATDPVKTIDLDNATISSPSATAISA